MAQPIKISIKHDLTRRRLIQGALALLREVGHEETSLRKLAYRLGVSHTMLYRYFKSKTALYSAARIQCFEALFAMIVRNDSELLDPNVRLAHAWLALKQYGCTFPKDYRFLFSMEQPETATDKEFRLLRHRLYDVLVSVATSARQRGQISMEPKAFTHVSWALLHGLISLYHANQFLEDQTFEGVVGAAFHHLFNRDIAEFQETVAEVPMDTPAVRLPARRPRQHPQRRSRSIGRARS